MSSAHASHCNHINQKKLNELKKRVNLVDKTSKTSNNKTTYTDLLWDELDKDTLESFLSSVDDVVRLLMLENYSDFHYMSDYILDDNDFNMLYAKMWNLFPLHAMAIVSLVHNKSMGLFYTAHSVPFDDEEKQKNELSFNSSLPCVE